MAAIEYELRRVILRKDEQIRELESLLGEKEEAIEDLKTALDKYKVH